MELVLGYYGGSKKNHYPPEFQVLCINCQFGKKYNNGICPHQTRYQG